MINFNDIDVDIKQVLLCQDDLDHNNEDGVSCDYPPKGSLPSSFIFSSTNEPNKSIKSSTSEDEKEEARVSLNKGNAIRGNLNKSAPISNYMVSHIAT